MDIFSLLGYGLSLFIAAIAFLTWKNAAAIQGLLEESLRRYDIMRKQLASQTQNIEKANEKLNLSREKVVSLEKEKNTLQKKLYELEESSLAEIEGFREKLRASELRLEHNTAEVEALLKQTKQADADRKKAENDAIYRKAEIEKQNSKSQQPLLEEIENLKKRITLSENQLKSASARINEFKKMTSGMEPKHFKAAQKKLHDYEHLYKSMRGLRDMADERSKNWETALRKLSGYILRQSKIELDPKHEPVGSVVGEALEIIGETLVADEHAPNGKE